MSLNGIGLLIHVAMSAILKFGRIAMSKRPTVGFHCSLILPFQNLLESRGLLCFTSCSSLNGTTQVTGPKISSFISLESSDTPVMTTGDRKYPLKAATAQHTTHVVITDKTNYLNSLGR